MPLRLNDYERVVFFTGAGMSAESGVPTYRGKGGVWREYDYEEYACQAAFDANPERVWEFHNYRRELIERCAPNAGHLAIARLQAHRAGAVVITQNIDGLHQQAGSQRVHELHGSIWKLRCDQCGFRAESREVPLRELRCPRCGLFKRPDFVWFGDNLFTHVLQAVERELESCQVLVAIGTSAVVYPAADMPRIAKRAGAVLIEVNPDETPLSSLYDHHLRTTASEALTVLCDGAGQL
jgi:NAD-dependent deacetylase